MVIHINPNRVNTTSGGKIGKRSASLQSSSPIVTPSPAHINFIPSPESLRTMISSAVEALRRGVFWERGTILNLLV